MNKKWLVYLLVFLPIASQTIALPLVNTINPIILGLPFIHFWLFLWIILTPLCTLTIHHLLKTERSMN